MTKNLLNNAVQLRHFAMLLAMLCGVLTAQAQLESDDINAAILVEGSVPVKWTNDTENPWYVPEGADYVRTPVGEDTITTSLAGTYTSSYPTEITLSWTHEPYTSGLNLTLEIDGEVKKTTSYNSNWVSPSAFIIPAGTHTIKFTSSLKRVSSNHWSGLKALRIWECKEPESVCLSDTSLPLTFKNEGDLAKMWITEDGYVRSQDTSNYTQISSTFTVKNRPAVFAFEYRNRRDHSYYTNCGVIIDGIWYSSTGSYNWSSNSVVLYPGEHTVVFYNWTSDQNSERDKYISELRNVRLVQNWSDVTLNAPGELGTRVTQALEGKPIQDLELLKINGAMNSDDWATIKLLTGIKAIDFSNTALTEIPGGGCSGLQVLSTVILPESLQRIGDSAFTNTNFYQISIPASVESIGNSVWAETPLTYIDFAKDSKLKTIGHSAFYKTRIMEFDMPDSVEELYCKSESHSNYVGNTPYISCSHLFDGCSSLTKLHLSERLSEIGPYTAYKCTSLSEVNIPHNTVSIGQQAFCHTNFSTIELPETVTYLGIGAFDDSAIESISLPKDAILGYGVFYDCKNLKTAYLNSRCWDMGYTFTNCTALEKVVLPCATPPTINNYSNNARDPFSGVNKSQVTLVVPDFAFDTYRTHSYWYGFTNTVKGDEASINDYWSLRGNLNLTGDLVMRGNPSVEMMEGSKLTLDNSSTQTFNEFTYHTSESTPSVVYSQSNSVKADRLVSKFYVGTKDKWFFFSPVTDVNMADVSYPSTDSWVIRYYDGARRANENATSGNWVNVPADGTLKGGQGYIIQARETGWLYLPAATVDEHDKFFGSNQVTFDLADNPCETEANAGWNFVANPYPTYYDIYYIDMQAPITVWTGSTYRAYSLNDGDRGDYTFVLRPMQPFFVQKNSADLKTGMPLVGRQINTTIDRSRAPRPVMVDENRHKLNLELYCDDNEEADDYTRVVINEAASLAYETVRDASKFMSMDTEVAQLYTLGNDALPMAINERPYEDGNVALGVYLPAADRTYRIAAMRADRKAWLFDAETGMEFDLTEGDYIFMASKTGIDNKRFSIRFAPSTNAVEGIEGATIKVTGNVGSISVSAPADAIVTVYSTDGSVTATAASEGSALEFAVAAGVYVVNVNGESFKTIVK